MRNPNENAITTIQTFIYYAAFQLYKVPENWTRSVGCISGCLFAIRRELLLELEPKIRSRHWFGIPVNQGEDRFLTHQTLLRGYGTYINNDALCWTTVPSTLTELFKQQLPLEAQHHPRSVLHSSYFATARVGLAPEHGAHSGAHSARGITRIAGGAYYAFRQSSGVGRSGASYWISGDSCNSFCGDQENGVILHGRGG